MGESGALQEIQGKSQGKSDSEGKKTEKDEMGKTEMGMTGIIDKR